MQAQNKEVIAQTLDPGNNLHMYPIVIDEDALQLFSGMSAEEIADSSHFCLTNNCS